MIKIAIDPGATGAIAIQTGNDITVHKMPPSRIEVMDFLYDLSSGEDCIAIVEHLDAGSQAQGPKKGVKQIWGIAVNFELIMCALYAARIRTVLVKPAKWMDKVPGKRPKEYKDRKNWLYAHAKTTYPDVKFPKYAGDAVALLSVMKEFADV